MTSMSGDAIFMSHGCQGVPAQATNTDQTVNSHGRNLLHLCADPAIHALAEHHEISQQHLLSRLPQHIFLSLEPHAGGPQTVCCRTELWF